MKLTTTQLVLVRFLGPTNTLGARIRITLPQLGKSCTIAYNYGLNSAAEGAADWLRSNGIPPKGRACVSRDTDALTIEPSDLTALFALFAGL